MTFHIEAITTETIDDARRTGIDASGNPVVRLDASGGEPLRCCLRDAAEGERMMLFGYRPDLPESPYREVGAVYVHAEACDGPANDDGYPAGWIGRPQVLRAYDDRGWIHPASRQHDGTDPARELAEVLAQPGVVQVHSRNIVYGCYMFRATR